MKTPQDPRHRKRQQLIQRLFSLEFHKQTVGNDVREIIKHQKVLDEKIQEAASDFPVEKINKIDLAILRLGIYELLIDKKAPQNVIIDESVELAKEFGNDSSPAFINGVLGHIMNNDKKKK